MVTNPEDGSKAHPIEVYFMASSGICGQIPINYRPASFQVLSAWKFRELSPTISQSQINHLDSKLAIP